VADVSGLDATPGGSKITHFCSSNAVDGVCPDNACDGDVKLSISIADGEKMTAFPSMQIYEGEHVLTLGMDKPGCGKEQAHFFVIKDGDAVQMAQMSVHVECGDCD